MTKGREREEEGENGEKGRKRPEEERKGRDEWESRLKRHREITPVPGPLLPGLSRLTTVSFISAYAK